MGDLYHILGVNKNASDLQIRQAYRKLALKYHPDKNPLVVAADARGKFDEIQKAYRTLTDVAKRNAYDGKLINDNKFMQSRYRTSTATSSKESKKPNPFKPRQSKPFNQQKATEKPKSTGQRPFPAACSSSLFDRLIKLYISEAKGSASKKQRSSTYTSNPYKDTKKASPFKPGVPMSESQKPKENPIGKEAPRKSNSLDSLQEPSTSTSKSFTKSKPDTKSASSSKYEPQTENRYSSSSSSISFGSLPSLSSSDGEAPHISNNTKSNKFDYLLGEFYKGSHGFDKAAGKFEDMTLAHSEGTKSKKHHRKTGSTTTGQSKPHKSNATKDIVETVKGKEEGLDVESTYINGRLVSKLVFYTIGPMTHYF